MPKQHLTDQFLRNATPEGKRVEYYDQHLITDNKIKARGVKGLFIRLTKAGSIYFYYRYYFNGNRRSYKIGSYPNIGLSDARDTARDIAGGVNNGIDPQAEKNAKKHKVKPKTFEYLADQFKKKHVARRLAPSTQKTYGERIDGEMIPFFGGMPVENISRGFIIELLERIAFERDSPYQSNRVRAILSSMFSFGVQREIAEYNPVKTIKPLGDEEMRERWLNDEEIRAVWEQFQSLREPSRSIFKVLLMLGQRLGETSKMRWTDIEYDKPFKRTYTDENGNDITETFLVDVWTIPKKDRRKNKVLYHDVPLPSLAMDIIENLKNDTPHVFVSRKNPGEAAKSIRSAWDVIRENTGINDIRPHDLRRTFKSKMAELGVDKGVTDRITNHKASGTVSRIDAIYNQYGYMNEKKMALNRWSHKLQQIIEGTETKIHKIG